MVMHLKDIASAHINVSNCQERNSTPTVIHTSHNITQPYNGRWLLQSPPAGPPSAPSHHSCIPCQHSQTPSPSAFCPCTACVSPFAPQVILPFAAALAQEEPTSHVAIELAWGASAGAAPLPRTAPSAGATPPAGAAPASAGQPVSTAGGPPLSSGVHTRWHRRVWVGKDDVCTLGSLVDAAKDVGLED